MRLHKDSHIDHGLTAKQLAHVLLTFDGRDAFFKETITLPDDLGTVPCGLFGPIMGDPAITDDHVCMGRRGEQRAYASRLIKLDSVYYGRDRRVNTLTVIAGPHEEVCTTCEGKILSLARAPGQNTDGWSAGCDHCSSTGKLKHACILYTAFGGPIAPKEPGDPTLYNGTDKGRAEIAESIAFWSEHALAF